MIIVVGVVGFIIGAVAAVMVIGGGTSVKAAAMKEAAHNRLLRQQLREWETGWQRKYEEARRSGEANRESSLAGEKQ